MKKLPNIFILIFFLFTISCFSQEVKLIVSSKDSIENNILKKLNLYRFDINKKEVDNKLDSITKQLHLYGYFNLEKKAIKNDSIINVIFNLKKSFKKIKIINLNDKLLRNEISLILKTNIDKNYFEIKTQTLPKLLSRLVSNFEKKGETFIQFSLKNIKLKDDFIIGEIFIKRSKERIIDKVIVKGYDNFPKSFIKNHLNIKPNIVFNKSKLDLISKSIKSISFAETIKKTRVLFTKDSTLLYIYLKKKKSNKFDGLIGFNSKENSSDIEFNGYLDLHLENMFNTGSEIDLVWKSNGNENQKFDLTIKTPYIFNAPILPKGHLQLYKQDSSYININTRLEIEYALNNKNSVAASIQNETSTNLLDNEILNSIQNFKTTFYGLHYKYQSFSNNDLFPLKFQANLNGQFGDRTSDVSKTSQTKLTISSFYNWQLNLKNYLYTQINSGYLISADYLDNELFRIGGTKTIRGFQEDSIFASLYNTVTIEYRHLTKNNAYLYSITDFGLIENVLIKNKIVSLGLGYAFETKLGSLNLNYVLGKSENQSFDFSNATINLKYITFF